MRRAMFAVFVMLSAPACGGTVAEQGAEASVSTPPTLSPPLIPLPAPKGAGGAKTPTNPYGPPGQAGCSFGVTGAVEAWVDDASSWAWVWPGGEVQCAGSTPGYSHSVGMSLGALHGPGAYATTSPSSYGRSWCVSVNSDCTTEGFASSPMQPGCVAELGAAPETWAVGEKVAGTFSCQELVDPNNAARTVTVYAGSFWAVVAPPPE